MIRSLFLVASLALASPISSASAKSVQKEFSEAWQDRMTRYEADIANAKAGHQEASKQFYQAASTNSTDTGSKMQLMFDKIRALGYAAARAQTLSDFQQFMEGKPSASRSELWMQDQIDQLKTQSSEVAAAFTAVESIKPGTNGSEGVDAFKSALDAVFKSGVVRGSADELSVLDQNIATFYRAKGEQDSRRRAAWAGALAGIGSAMQNASRPPPMLPPTSFTCRTFGNTTNCNGH